MKNHLRKSSDEKWESKIFKFFISLMIWCIYLRKNIYFQENTTKMLTIKNICEISSSFYCKNNNVFFNDSWLNFNYFWIVVVQVEFIFDFAGTNIMAIARGIAGGKMFCVYLHHAINQQCFLLLILIIGLKKSVMEWSTVI